MSSRSSGWTRRGARSCAEVGIDTASTAVKRSFIGDERGRNQVKVIDGAGPARLPPSVEMEDILLLAPLLRFACDLDGGTRKKLVRAAVKVASEKEQRREQEVVPGQKGRSA